MTAGLASLSQPLIGLAGVLVGLLVAWFSRPKFTAEAGKADAERDTLDWTRFHAEIARQDAKIATLEDKLLRQEAEIENLKHDRDDRDEALVNERKENRKLQALVARLGKRLEAIEALFKAHPIPPELRAALDKLDGKDPG